MIRVVISIINFNSAKETLECLESLQKIDTTDLDVQIVVIDNASKEALVIPPEIKEKLSIHFIKSDINTGFSGGHNRGIDYALKMQADYVLILNNDTVVDPDFLKALVAAAKEYTEAGIIAPKIYFAPGHEYHKARYEKKDQGKVIWYAGGIMDWKNVYGKHRGVDEVDHGQFDQIESTDFASGCCMLLPRNVLEKVGGFDERYFLYYEDSDLNIRIKKKGYTILYMPKAHIWHVNAGSTGGSGSTLQDYFITRNRLLLGFTYASFRTRFALVRESMRIIRKGRTWQKKGVRDFYMRKFGKGSYLV